MSIDCCDYGCSQGRNCPVRTTPLRTHEGGEQVADGLPVAMFVTFRQRIGDLLLDMVCWTGTATLVVIVFACVVFIVFFALGFASSFYHSL